jgi:hypothetical protein
LDEAGAGEADGDSEATAAITIHFDSPRRDSYELDTEISWQTYGLSPAMPPKGAQASLPLGQPEASECCYSYGRAGFCEATIMTNPLPGKSLEELVDAAGSGPPGAVQAEFMRRQTIELMTSATYMRRTFYAIAATSGVTALFTFLSWYAPHSK